MTVNYITSVGVQQFSITIASGHTTGTANINAVGSGAFICFGGVNPSVLSDPAQDYSYVTLTNSTTITATRNDGTTGTVLVRGCVVDGDTTNLIKSVQYGTVTIADTTSSGTATVTGVTDANAAIHLLGWQSANTTYSGINENPVLTQASTTVTATRQGTVGQLIVGFVLIEFQGSSLNQAVQRVSNTSSSNVTSFIKVITSVTWANCIPFYAGSMIATSTTSLNQIKMYGTLFENTPPTSTDVDTFVNTGVANAKTYDVSIVEFVSGVLKTQQSQTPTLTGVTSSVVTLPTPTNINYTGVSWLGNSYSAANADLNRAEGAVQVLAAGTSQGNSSAITTSAATKDVVIVVPVASSSGGGGNPENPTASTGYTLNNYSCYKIETAQVTAETTTLTFSDTSTSYCSSSAAFKNNTTITLTQVASASSATSPVTVALTGSSSGDLLVAAIVINNALSPTGTVTGVTDNLGQTWSQVTGAQANDGAFENTDIWYFANSAAGVTSVIVSVSATLGVILTEAYDFAGAVTSNPVDAHSVISSGTTATNTNVNITKNVATANITGSWEVFEFPAFVAPGGSSYVFVGGFF